MGGVSVGHQLAAAAGGSGGSPALDRVALGLVALVAITVVVLGIAGVGLRWGVVTAALRASVQLSVVTAAIRGVFAEPALAALFIGLMAGVAIGTAARRLRILPHPVRNAGAAILGGSGAVLALAFAVPLVPRTTSYLIALSGIVLGNTMNACTLSGRAFHHGLTADREEIEGMLAIGATPRAACLPARQRAIRESLLPSLDTTRTVGLVTLPGAFVGALAGGAGPAEAARFQLVVLLCIVTAQAVAATSLTWLVGAPTTLPESAR
jgi:putative ABC transport system permease protein